MRLLEFARRAPRLVHVALLEAWYGAELDALADTLDAWSRDDGDLVGARRSFDQLTAKLGSSFPRLIRLEVMLMRRERSAAEHAAETPAELLARAALYENQGRPEMAAYARAEAQRKELVGALRELHRQGY